ncbi:hypothetical protein VTO73DRAFT_1380 [Trametes versicolor]
MTADLNSGSLFTDDYQTPTPSPHHPTRDELRAWRLPSLDLDDPFLDEPTPRPTLADSPLIPSFTSFDSSASSLHPWSSVTHSLSSSGSVAFESSDSYSSSASISPSASILSSASLQAPSPAPPTTHPVDIEEEDDQTHVFGIPLFILDRIPSTQRDPDEDEIDEYNRIALDLPRDSSAPPSTGWSRLSRYEEDYYEWLNYETFAFPHAPSPVVTEDPHGEPDTPVDPPSDEDDDQTHVFGIPVFNLDRTPFTQRDPNQDEIDEYNRIALNLPRDNSAAPSADWVLPSDYDEDWEEFDAVMCLFPPLALPADMEDPYGEPSAPVDSPWDEDDNKTHVFGIPLADLDRTPFTQCDADDKEINEYLDASLGYKLRPDSNVPPAQGWWKGSEYDKAKLDDFLRTALTMPLDSTPLPTTGWLLPSGHDENRHRDELAAYAYPGFPIPEHLRIPVVRIPVDTG